MSTATGFMFFGFVANWSISGVPTTFYVKLSDLPSPNSSGFSTDNVLGLSPASVVLLVVFAVISLLLAASTWAVSGLSGFVSFSTVFAWVASEVLTTSSVIELSVSLSYLILLLSSELLLPTPLWPSPLTNSTSGQTIASSGGLLLGIATDSLLFPSFASVHRATVAYSLMNFPLNRCCLRKDHCFLW